MSYSVVLAGISGRIINDVLNLLRKRYSNGYVFRGAGAQVRADRMTMYDDAEINKSVHLSSDAIFGKSARPHGFCRKIGKPCAIKNASKNDCGLSSGASCFLEKPSNFVMIFQEGHRQDDPLSKFHFSPLSYQISTACYDKTERTLESIISSIEFSKKIIPGIISNSGTSNSPLLLPPKNFKMNSLKALLRITPAVGVGKPHANFRKENFDKAEKAYVNRNGFLFPPASANIRHGLPSVNNNTMIAITREFRIGCAYPRDFQYDVRRIDGKNFDGSIPFVCRNQGTKYPTSRHVNITVDDCII